MPRLFLLFLFTVLPLFSQSLTIVSVANSADAIWGLPDGGSLGAIFCTGLEGGPAAIGAPPGYPLPTSLGNVTVLIDSVPAPILSIDFEQGYQQINIQVPWETGKPSSVQVSQGSRSATLANAGRSDWPWSVFFTDATGHAIVQHASDYSLVTPQNPAHPGEYLIAYGVNLGKVSNTPATGYPAPSDPVAVVQLPKDPTACYDTYTITPFQLAWAGLAPGTVGVYQLNFYIPASYQVFGQLSEAVISFSHIVGTAPFHLCSPDQMLVTSITTESRAVPLWIQ